MLEDLKRKLTFLGLVAPVKLKGVTSAEEKKR